jgi:N-acetylmuramic acid 6-phosphate (MurNAc-6-P) etherase
MILFTCFFSWPLHLLHLIPSAQSLDYVENKKEFQLHTLTTEQRHPKTWNLSSIIQKNTAAGIEALLSVDVDISNKFKEMAEDMTVLEEAASAVERAILEKRKIYIYGCGATGRLAKQVESSFWRPFWEKMDILPELREALIGEMTGADRALISSLEGFEDLPLIGKLQLEDRKIQAGDLVFAITEGGETSSVIGTILAALHQYENPEKAKENLYFMYNNPDEVLLPFARSRSVLENEAITKIRLFTGPQSITGSTRMQATTSETFVMGILLEHAICQVLKRHLSEKELQELGFDSSLSLKDRLLSFVEVQETVFKKRDEIAAWTDLEVATYENKCFSTYFAKDALITVFTDATERSPTFKLLPLDTCDAPERKAWIQIWTPAKDSAEAWQNFLRRPFRGLDPTHYELPFSTVADPYLRSAALSSLKKGGHDQQFLYDFAFGEANIEKRGPQPGDLGMMILLDQEMKEGLPSPCQDFLRLFQSKGANVRTILSPVGSEKDPLGVRQHIGLKMLLNAHSTGVMAKLGRVVGNTMVNVHPGNLKLIGRASFLIQSHVNDSLGLSKSISYADANAVLFDAIDYGQRAQKVGQIAEVPMSIIRILEGERKQSFVSWEAAEEIWKQEGLEAYLQRLKKTQ